MQRTLAEYPDNVTCAVQKKYKIKLSGCIEASKCSFCEKLDCKWNKSDVE